MVLGLWDFLFCVQGLGRLPLEGIFIRCGEVATFLISHASEVFIRSQDGTPQRLTPKFESRDEWPVARD